jgi:hypothetical protein
VAEHKLCVGEREINQCDLPAYCVFKIQAGWGSRFILLFMHVLSSSFDIRTKSTKLQQPVAL